VQSCMLGAVQCLPAGTVSQSGILHRKSCRLNAETHPLLASPGGTGSGIDVEKSISQPAYQAMCRRLRRLRERAGLTQTQLAARIGTGQKFVSEYERGQRRLDILELRAITAAIGGPAAAIVAQLDALDAVMTALDYDPPT
jgi:DNA-binding transcriptional regulator YiaG